MKLSELRKVIREEVKNNLNEAISPQAAFEIGQHIGPNARKKIDETSPEAVYIKKIADKLYNQGYPLKKLTEDKILSAFIEGFVYSVSSDRYRNEGLSTMVGILTRVAVNGYPPKGQSLGALKI